MAKGRLVLPGQYVDWVQEAQVDQQWIGSPDRNFKDGSDYDPSRGSGREYVWTDDAACSTADPELFQVTQKGDPEAGDMVGQRLNQYNLDKFELALTYCEECPIKQTCLDQATPMDRHWSVRGGELPTKVAGERNQRKNVPSFDYKSYVPKWECQIHGIKWVSSHKKTRPGRPEELFYYCLECNRKS